MDIIPVVEYLACGRLLLVFVHLYNHKTLQSIWISELDHVGEQKILSPNLLDEF